MSAESKLLKLSDARLFESRTLQMTLLTLAVLAANYARTAIGPLQETMRVALALSDNQIALIQGPALSMPVVIAAIPLGLVIDRYSRVRLVLILAILNVMGSVFTALAPSFVWLFAARCLVGLTATATFTASLSLVADLYAPEQRGRATTAIAVCQIVGMSAAFALGGALAAKWGASSDGWRWAILSLVIPMVPILLLTLAMREPARTGLSVKNPTISEAWPELWRYRGIILPLLAGMIMVEMALGACLVWAAPALSRAFGLSPDRTGTIIGVVLLVSGVLGPLVGGTLADLSQKKGGPRRTLLFVSGVAILSLPTGLFAFVSGLVLASVLLILFIMTVSAACVMGTTLFTVVIPNELRGLCVAIMSAACFLLAIGFAPLGVSLLSNVMGGESMIGEALAIVGMLTSLLGAITFNFARRYFPTIAPR